MIRTAHWIMAASHYGWVRASRVGCLGMELALEDAARLEFPAVHVSGDVLVFPDLPETRAQGWMEVGK